MVVSATQELCKHLEAIAQLLEKGDPESAAAVVAEMNILLSSLPASMPADEAAEAGRLLERCVGLEKEMRSGVIASLKRLGASRKAMTYRHRGLGP
jgi:hypothetical protein